MRRNRSFQWKSVLTGWVWAACHPNVAGSEKTAERNVKSSAVTSIHVYLSTPLCQLVTSMNGHLKLRDKCTHLTLLWSLSPVLSASVSLWRRKAGWMLKREHTGKVESTCSNRDAFRSVIPTARCASRLWECDESGQAPGYVAVALDAECVLFDFKSPGS